MGDLCAMLASSRTALSKLERDIAALGPQPVCHHFYPEQHADHGSDEERRYLDLIVPALVERGLDVDAIGGQFGVEAWEKVAPSEEWLAQTLPVLNSIASEARCSYGGWSWEPSRASR